MKEFLEQNNLLIVLFGLILFLINLFPIYGNIYLANLSKLNWKQEIILLIRLLIGFILMELGLNIDKINF
jgi:hypothetical protein